MEIKIGTKKIGANHPAFIVAELSGNHNQNFDIAVKTLKAIKISGADAVKLQTYTADTITINCNNKYFQIKQGTIWDGQTLYDLYKKAYTPWDWQPKLKKVADDLGLIFFSSPFDKTAVDFLEKMHVPAYKIASLEITDTNLIEYVAKKQKPIIIATGIAEYNDIDLAVKICRKVKNNRIILLKCASEYPTPLEDMNLRTIPDMANKFNTITGLSDHSLGTTSAVSSIALGAKMIEKHFILNKKIGGPDCKFSLEPNEFKSMVDEIRNADKSLGEVTYTLTNKMKKSREHSRSLFVISNVSKGDILTNDNISSIRPGYGLAPKYLYDILGRHALKNIERGTPLSWKLIKNTKVKDE
jgi:pseudaminic acid synthase